ncbi:MAG TPA: hypothetical protein VGB83_02570 [Actinomycetota bacterium]
MDKGWRRRARRMLSASLIVGGSVLFATAVNVHAAPGGPPGNNGTVKIDGVAFDDHPNNQPHVGCVFQIDFYGYEEGDLSASYSVALHAPTGSGVLAEGDVAIGGDPAGGGTDLDGSVTLDLTDALAASNAEPHAIQGYHVKLTVNADGSRGADKKHKVFWIECEAPEVEPTETETETEVLPTETERPEAEVKGVKLAKTGPETPLIALLGTLMVMTGIMLQASRRKLARVPNK